MNSTYLAAGGPLSEKDKAWKWEGRREQKLPVSSLWVTVFTPLKGPFLCNTHTCTAENSHFLFQKQTLSHSQKYPWHFHSAHCIMHTVEWNTRTETLKTGASEGHLETQKSFGGAGRGLPPETMSAWGKDKAGCLSFGLCHPSWVRLRHAPWPQQTLSFLPVASTLQPVLHPWSILSSCFSVFLTFWTHLLHLLCHCPPPLSFSLSTTPSCLLCLSQFSTQPPCSLYCLHRSKSDCGTQFATFVTFLFLVFLLIWKALAGQMGPASHTVWTPQIYKDVDRNSLIWCKLIEGFNRNARKVL